MNLRKFVSVLLLCFVSATSNAADLTELYNAVKTSVLRIEAKDHFGNTVQMGTGFYIGNGCYIATNYHIVKGSPQIAAIDGEENSRIELEHYKVNTNYDLAIIPTPHCGTALRLDGSLPRIGQEIITVGNPRGLDNTLSNGVVSGIREGVFKVIQTTAAISPGSSGGPLVNMAGTVIGMTTFYLKESQNLNFAIPSGEIVELLNSANYLSESERKIATKQNALSVASSFYWAIHNNDIERALSFVDPSEQTEFEKVFTDFPKIPASAEFEIYEGAPIRGNPHAEVGIKGTKIGIDLVRYRNGWWVVK